MELALDTGQLAVPDVGRLLERAAQLANINFRQDGTLSSIRFWSLHVANVQMLAHTPRLGLLEREPKARVAWPPALRADEVAIPDEERESFTQSRHNQDTIIRNQDEIKTKSSRIKLQYHETSKSHVTLSRDALLTVAR